MNWLFTHFSDYDLILQFFNSSSFFAFEGKVTDWFYLIIGEVPATDTKNKRTHKYLINHSVIGIKKRPKQVAFSTVFFKAQIDRF